MKVSVIGIDKVISDLEKYMDKLPYKMRRFAKELGDIGYEQAYTLYSNALYAGENDIVVDHPFWNGDTLVLSASGETITFIEFGTGVWKYGGDIHPQAEEFGFRRGEYGYHLGKLRSWRYEGVPGNLGKVITEGKHKGEIETEGNPPAKAMYFASKEMRENILTKAKEIFNG